MKLYRLKKGCAIELDNQLHHLPEQCWNQIFHQDSPINFLSEKINSEKSSPLSELPPTTTLADKQETWAAGVTYLRSKKARMEESKEAGGGDFYDRVYDSQRPELFFKATPENTVPSGETMFIRADSEWQVPEPELTLVLNHKGNYIGYTAGNDLSSRDIEGENPLYLPQAKVWRTSASLGPCIHLTTELPSPETTIKLAIIRHEKPVVEGNTAISQMKQTFPNLIEYLTRHLEFPNGCYLMTGTGIIPPDEFTLKKGDRVDITIDGVGTLSNPIDQF